MERVSWQSVQSMSYLLFTAIETFEVEKDEPFDLPLKMGETDYEKKIKEELKSFLNQINYLLMEKEDDPTSTNEYYVDLVRIAGKGLADVESFGTEEYSNKLQIFNKELPDDTVIFVEDVINKAVKVRRANEKFNKDPKKHFELISKTLEEIKNIYEESNGEPEIKPYIECPICNVKTDNYDCAWNYNKHVAFCCEHCEHQTRM